jgi:protein O-GlcNAc transferase
VMPGSVQTQAMGLLQAGQLDKAEALLRQALRRRGRDPEVAYLLGLCLSQRGQPEQAEYFLKAAVGYEPRSPVYRVGLGNHLTQANRFGDAAAVYREAIDLQPGFAPAHMGLALCLLKSGDIEGAEASAREVVRLEPGIFQPRVNLASILTEGGSAAEGAAILQEARAHFPKVVPVVAALMTTLNYVEGAEERGAAAARELGKLLPPAPVRAFGNAPDPARRLRVGLVSGDLRQHSVAYFLEPILAGRRRESLEVFCYPTHGRADEVTARLRGLSDGWVEAGGLGPEALVQRVVADRVDILIDLAGHTGNSRVLAMAQRAAPVQATYLGYPASTGVPAIDWRIVDAITDPPGSEGLVTERLLRLPGCFLCYRPPADSPAVGPRQNGPVTFGSFNSLRKITPAVLGVWADVLAAAPGSRLVLKNRSLADAGVRARLEKVFAGKGIAAERLELLPPAPSPREHLAVYGRVDIALDTFPYNGTTTTCEALWMGVPVVTLEGRAHAGRVGMSLLTTAGLENLIGRTREEYIRIATGLAGSPGELSGLRAGLRDRVAASPLRDEAGFTARFEAGLREMWGEWCRARR